MNSHKPCSAQRLKLLRREGQRTDTARRQSYSEQSFLTSRLVPVFPQSSLPGGMSTGTRDRERMPNRVLSTCPVFGCHCLDTCKWQYRRDLAPKIISLQPNYEEPTMTVCSFRPELGAAGARRKLGESVEVATAWRCTGLCRWADGQMGADRGGSTMAGGGGGRHLLSSMTWSRQVVSTDCIHSPSDLDVLNLSIHSMGKHETTILSCPFIEPILLVNK